MAVLNHQSSILVGEKVLLRSISLADCTECYLSWLQDPEVNKYLETRWHHQSLKTIRTFVSEMIESEDSYLFAIVEKGTNCHVGNLKIGPIDPYHNNADISYFIGEKKRWGMGYATEAIKMGTEFGFTQLKLHRLQAGVYASNIGSKKALEKIGYRYEGSFQEALRGNHGWEDHLKFGLLKRIWKSA